MEIAAQAVEKLAALTLAALVSLSQSFSAGTTALEKKDYEPAVKAFTAVIDAKVDDNPLLEPALYFRARCYAATKKDKAAVADLTRLLKADAESGLARLAKADFKKLAGKPWDGVDLSTPSATWKSLVAAIRRRDPAAVGACCTGEIKTDLQGALGEEDFWEEASEEIFVMTVDRVAYNKGKTKALVLFKQKDGGEEKIIMHREGKQWRLAEEYRESKHANEFDLSKARKPRAVPLEKIKLADTDKKQIAALVKQLGARNAAQRKAAYQKLKALGAKAAPILIKASRDPDPEIAVQAKALLDDL
jgi:Holliday junction resolvase